MNVVQSATRGIAKSTVLAGLAGGIAEVLWIGAYCAATPLSATEVLRQITASVIPAAAQSSGAPAMGLTIHLALSIALAMAFRMTIGVAALRRFGAAGVFGSAMAALSAVWVFNFFVLLPQINPVFVSLMPDPVTLVSKLLFGVAMGYTLLLDHGTRVAAVAPLSPSLVRRR